MQSIEEKWYNKYVGLPYKHLGDSVDNGIDCWNLCALVLKEQCDYEVPWRTIDFCNIIEEDWYTKTHERWIDNAFSKNDSFFEKLDLNTPLQLFDIITMSLGSTNVTNHCAIYVDRNKVLQTMIKHKSWIAPYGNYYKQYTTGIYRWKISSKN